MDGKAAASQRALQQAADWFARLRDGAAGEAEHAAWRRWYDAAAEHRQAWAFVERVGSRFAPIRATPDPRLAAAALQAAAAPRLRRRGVVFGAAAFAGGLSGWTLWRDPALAAPLLALWADERSAVGELREIVLADGSRVWLASASAFDQEYGRSLRRLRLLAGELMVRTGADERAFVVDLPQGRLRALGTRFTVRLEDDGLGLVAVHAGAVELRAAAGAAVRRVQAGEQLRFDAAGAGPLQPVDPAREAWTRGLLIARAMPLAQVVAELQRWHRGRITLAPEIAALPVFGSYPLRDAGRTLAMLSSVMPIGVRRPLPGWTRVEPAPGR